MGGRHPHPLPPLRKRQMPAGHHAGLNQINRNGQGDMRVTNILTLTLKRKWFDLILAGTKTEEYREITDYWARRFLNPKEEIEWQVWEEMLDDMQDPFRRYNGPADLMAYLGIKFKDYEAIRFRNGYRKDSPVFTIDLAGIEIKQGREEWGAEKDKFYFVLQLGSKRNK